MNLLERIKNGDPPTFQIFGAFHEGFPVVTCLLVKGQLMGDGTTFMESWEREFHESEGDEFLLMEEFTLPDLPYQDDFDVWATAKVFDAAYWKGWFKRHYRDKTNVGEGTSVH